MYSVGINAAKEFANRLRFGKFRDNSGNKYAINADERKQAKSEYKNGGKIVKADDKIAYISKNHAFTSAEILEKLGSKESAMLSELYDIAYEDARRDLEMKAEYIRAFESVPDAFDEFETEI